MVPSNYDGPSNGDYVSYVEKLMRASPDYRRTLRSIDGAVQSAVSTPGVQADSPVAQLRDKLQKARELVEQQVDQQAARKKAAMLSPSASPAQRAAQTAQTAQTGQSAGSARAVSRQEAQQRFRAIEQEIESQKAKASADKSTPLISPFSVVMIVAGIVISQFASGFGTMLVIMGGLSLVGGVVNKLKGK